jgi:hypothetical protein
MRGNELAGICLMGPQLKEGLMPTMDKLRQAAFSLLFIMSAVLISSAGTSAKADQRLSAFFSHICIWTFDLAEDSSLQTRTDLAERVADAIRPKVEAAVRNTKRKVWAAPNCIKADQPGFDMQLSLNLSVKRQKVTLDSQVWNLVVAGGVSTNGLIQDREVQPVVLLQRENISEDGIIDALVSFVDRVVVTALRRP